MDRAGTELRRVEVEIAEEKAAALARIAGRLQQLIDEAASLRAEAAAGGRRAIGAYDTVRRQAQLYRWYLQVQREAVGLSRHDDLDAFYPVPPRLDAAVR
jgi:hypothetical protein